MLNMLPLAFALVALSGAATAAPIEDHLEPPMSTFDIPWHAAYEAALVRVLGLQDKTADVQMIVMPSFEREYAVRIECDDDRCAHAKVVRKRADRDGVWGAHSAHVKRTKTKDNAVTTSAADDAAAFADVDVGVSIASNTIDGDTVTLLERLWDAALSQTRFSESWPLGLDGVSYVFSARTPKKGVRTAEVWSPNAKAGQTKMAALVDVGEQLVRYAEARDGLDAQRLKLRASAQAAFALFGDGR